jgi:predicted dehydrogenase
VFALVSVHFGSLRFVYSRQPFLAGQYEDKLAGTDARFAVIRVGVIGYGYWGPNLVRNFSASHLFHVLAVAEPRASAREALRRTYPHVLAIADATELLEWNNIDAVAIATPAATHYDLAMQALEKGKHVLVEKPLCMSVDHANDLVAFAKKQGLVLLVDHVFLFHSAVRKLKELLLGNSIGKVSYFDSLRINLGLFQPDVSVLWDLAPHDFAIMDYLFGEDPEHVEATGYCHVNPHLPDIVYVTAHYKSQMIGHLNLSWMSPVKARRIAVGGTKQMVVWDDLNLEERLKIYDSGIEFHPESERLAIVPGYRIGDISSPRIFHGEALAGVVEEFARVITERTASIIDGSGGIRVVRILEKAQKALDHNLRNIANLRDSKAAT